MNLLKLMIALFLFVLPCNVFAQDDDQSPPCPDITLWPGPGPAGNCFKYQSDPGVWLVWCGHEPGEGQIDIEVDLDGCKNRPCEVVNVTVTVGNDDGYWEVPEWFIWPVDTLFADYRGEVDIENLICGINIVTVCVTYNCGGDLHTECEIIILNYTIGCPPQSQPSNDP